MLKNVIKGLLSNKERMVHLSLDCYVELIKLIRSDIFSSNINVGLSQLLDEMYFKFILNEATQVGNCTFLDTGGVFQKFDNGYKLSIVKLSDYC